MAATSPEVLVDQENARSARTPKSHIAALTGLRGFAALGVVLVHGSGPTDYPWVGLHSYGPIALFVLSGFLLFQPWSKWMLGLGRRPAVRTFAKRRILRIFPPYLAALFIVALVLPASRPRGIEGWLHSVTLTQTFSPMGLRTAMGHVWSLNTEITWYAVLPLVGFLTAISCLRFRVRPVVAMWVLLATALVVTVLWRAHIAYFDHDLATLLTRPFWFPGFAVCFIGGAFISHLVIEHRVNPESRFQPVHWFAQRPWIVIATVVAAAAVANSSLGGQWTWGIVTTQERSIRFAFTTVFALALLAAVSAGPPSSPIVRIFSKRWIVAIGRWSYGIYLWHLPVRELLMNHMEIPIGAMGLALWIGLILAVSIPLGAATYAFIERPTMGWSKRP